MTVGIVAVIVVVSPFHRVEGYDRICPRMSGENGVSDGFGMSLVDQNLDLYKLRVSILPKLAEIRQNSEGLAVKLALMNVSCIHNRQNEYA